LLPEKSKETTSKIQNRGLTSYPLPVKQVTSELMGKTVGEIEDIEMQEVEQ
jgi:hypothetical protein